MPGRSSRMRQNEQRRSSDLGPQRWPRRAIPELMLRLYTASAVREWWRAVRGAAGESPAGGWTTGAASAARAGDRGPPPRSPPPGRHQSGAIMDGMTGAAARAEPGWVFPRPTTGLSQKHLRHDARAIPGSSVAQDRCSYGVTKRGAGGNRTRVLRRWSRTSPGAVCVTFSQPRRSRRHVADRLSRCKSPDQIPRPGLISQPPR